MTKNIEELTCKALDAFWSVITENFPAAVSGDLSPLTTNHLSNAAETAVEEWIGNNVPSPAHAPGPWFVDRQSPYSALCIKPYPGRIVCDIQGTDAESEANARLIAAAPKMLERLKLAVKDARDAISGAWKPTTDGGQSIIQGIQSVIDEAECNEREPRGAA